MASATAPGKRPLVFLHIPKSSGIAVSHALLAAERPPRVFFGFDRAFFGGFNDFASVPPENRAYIHLSAATIPRDETFIRAHMSLSTLRTAYPNARFMTVLREPICRILSHYAFWRGFSAEQDAGWGGWAARSGLARGRLEDFLAAGEIACQIDNVATRLLLWPHPLIPADAPIPRQHDEALLAAAQAALATLDFVDVIENLDFYANLAAWLGSAMTPIRLNETQALPAALHTRLDLEMTPRVLQLLTERSRLDLALWQAAIRTHAPRANGDAVRTAALLQGVARTASLLAGAA